MNSKNEYSFPMMIIAVVLGVTIYKQFDFETFRFNNPAIGVVYILTFLMTIYFIFKKKKEKEKEEEG